MTIEPHREAAANEHLSRFLADLTALSDRYGIAIGDAPTLFMMEPEDRSHRYGCDGESRLTRG